jgi:BirA family biotin operon repressor/biotin-[acetyl-CoA-carboxylase] ligase
VKWPNDLVLAKSALAGRAAESDGKLGPYRKVGGVLVEAVRFSGAPAHGILDACVVGVGLNVGSCAWPAELLPIAGSLADAGYRGAVDDVVSAVHRELPLAVGRALADFDGTLALLRAHSATLGRRVSSEGATGLAQAIDDDGALVVVDERGVTHTIRAGDVWLDGATVAAT